MTIQESVDLGPFLSFGNQVVCSKLFKIEKVGDLHEYFDDHLAKDYLILGGGSNMLVQTTSLERDILHMGILGKEVILKELEYDIVRFGAGENWHDTVLWSLDQGYGGIENLSLIPGTIGAGPIQNIGAYGVELKDTLHAVYVFDTESQNTLTLHHSECEFGYRDSIFKSGQKGRFIILGISLKLTKQNHKIVANYGAISDLLRHYGIEHPTPKEISNIVIEIRNSKLPDPKVLGNGGSFFKNPIVSREVHSNLLISYPNIPSYPTVDKMIKIPAGWLIEQAGWKGKRVGKVGCHEHQALVIVNYGKASGSEIWEHAITVQNSVKEKFGILLTPEVNLIQ